MPPRTAKAPSATNSQRSSMRFQNRANPFQRTRRRPAVRLYQRARLFAHSLSLRRIRNQFAPRLAKLFAARNLNSCSRARKSRRHFAKVLHERPKNRRLAEPRRFQNIVPADRHQRTAHERHIRQRVQSSQFADGIENHHLAIFVERRIHINFAAPPNRPSILLCNFRCARKPVRLPRRKHQQRPSPLPLHNIVRREHRLLFPRCDAARHEHRPPLLLRNLLRQPLAKRRLLRRLMVVLQISRDFDSLLRRAHRYEPARILRALRQKQIRLVQRVAEKSSNERLEPPESRKRPLRNSAVHEHHRHIAPVRLAQKVRPYFRFENHHQRRFDALKCPSHRRRPVKRKIKCRVCRDSFARNLLARHRRRRKKNRRTRKAFLHRLDKRLSRQHFADRNRMHPNRRPRRHAAPQLRRQIAHPLSKILKRPPALQPAQRVV